MTKILIGVKDGIIKAASLADDERNPEWRADEQEFQKEGLFTLITEREVVIVGSKYELGKPKSASTSTVLTDEETYRLVREKYPRPERWSWQNLSTFTTSQQDAHTRHQIAEWLEKWADYPNVKEFSEYIAKLKE